MNPIEKFQSWWDGKYGSQFRAEEEATRARKHAECVKNRDLLNADERDARAKLRPDLEAAERALSAAKAALLKATQHHAILAMKDLQIRTDAATRRDKLTSELERLADPRLKEAIARLNTRIERIQAGEFARVVETKKADWRMGESPFTVASNAKNREIVLKAAFTARRELQKLSHRTVPDLEAAITEIDRAVGWERLEILESVA